MNTNNLLVKLLRVSIVILLFINPASLKAQDLKTWPQYVKIESWATQIPVEHSSYPPKSKLM